MLIYVVDDHELMRDAIVIIMRHLKKNAAIRDFGSFEAFLKSVDDFGIPHLLILDLTLPNISGYDGVRRARQKCPDSKIVIYSALPAIDHSDACLASGADVYCEKSNSSMNFKNTLKKFIN